MGRTTTMTSCRRFNPAVYIVNACSSPHEAFLIDVFQRYDIGRQMRHSANMVAIRKPTLKAMTPKQVM